MSHLWKCLSSNFLIILDVFTMIGNPLQFLPQSDLAFSPFECIKKSRLFLYKVACDFWRGVTSKKTCKLLKMYRNNEQM